MQLSVNGEPLTLPDDSTILDVVALLTDGVAPKGIAVAVDREVIPRSQWADTPAHSGAAIEVVTAAAGG